MTRIEHLELAAYGHYRGRSLDLSSPKRGLTVIWGPNEAGKSTARRALLAALFGFETKDPGAFGQSITVLQIGVQLSAKDGSSLHFVRSGGKKPSTPAGEEVEEALLEHLRGGISRTTYGRLFSISHDELRSGSESLLQAGGEIGSLLYGASLGAGSVAAVQKRLQGRADGLFKGRGTAQQIPKAKSEFTKAIAGAKNIRVRAEQWEKLDRALKEAKQAHGIAEQERNQAEADRRRLEKIRTCRPAVGQKRNLEAELQHIGQVPGEDWAKRAEAASEAFREFRSNHERLLSERQRLISRIEEIHVNDVVLQRADGIGALIEGLEYYRRAVKDLPGVKADAQAAKEIMEQELRLAGSNEANGAIVPDIQLAAIEQLIGQYAELENRRQIAAEELRSARQAIAEAEAELDKLPPDPNPAMLVALEHSIEVATNKAEALALVDREQAAHSAEAQQHKEAALRLGLGQMSLDEVVSLALPGMAAVEAERLRRESQRKDREHLDRQISDARARIEEIQASIEQLSGAAPGDEQLKEARRHRDQGWALLRERLAGRAVDESWAAGLGLEEAFSAAIEKADLLADQRYLHAEELATLAKYRADLKRAREALQGLQDASQLLEEKDAAALGAWERLWTEAGVSAGSPDEMSEWIDKHNALVDAIQTWRKKEAEANKVRGEAAQLVHDIAGTLSSLGATAGPSEIGPLTSHARAVLTSLRHTEQERSTKAELLERTRREEPRRDGALRKIEDEIAAWRQRWEEALVPFSLPPSAEPAAVRTVPGHYRSAAKKAEELRELNQRQRDMENNCDDYATKARAAAEGLMSLSSAGVPDTVAQLKDLLAKAQADRQTRSELETESQRIHQEAEAAAVAFAGAERKLRELRAEAKMAEADDPLYDLASLLNQTRQAAALRHQLAEVRETLAEQASPLSIEEIEAQVLSASEDLETQLHDAEARSDECGARLERAVVELERARSAAGEVRGEADAAELEQDAEAHLAQVSEGAQEYAVIAVALSILEKSISDYAKSHEGPLLQRAKVIFADLTGGAFSDLVTEVVGDRQVLVAIRRSGDPCSVEAMSDGTRDQLYLALRLAALEHQLDAAANPVPVVLDDVLVNFDDTRAAAALGALARLGEHTQVLLFTHHERVAEIARQELGTESVAVVRLEARDHDTPSSWGRSEAYELATKAGLSRHGTESAILKAARAADGQGLSKSELLDASSVAEESWNQAIKSLLAQGLLRQEGNKRGARYYAMELRQPADSST